MNPKPLYILGAGGFGRETWNWLATHPDSDRQWKCCGFLDDNPAALAGFDYPQGVVGPITGHQPDTAAWYVCALGKPQVKERICTALLAAGAHFLTVVHPTAQIGRNVVIGEGSVICPGVIITCDVQVGRFVMLNCRTVIGHDASIGDFSTLSGACEITGAAKLGRGVFLGTHAAVIPGKSVGDYAVVGAGAIVMSKVPAGATAYAPPAKLL